MRITGGRARGIPLIAPTGQGTRPATDRMREAVFSSLGPLVEGSRCLDLFAGTGAYGLEALSRGATAVSFVENDTKALRALKTNQDTVLKSLNLQPGNKIQTSKADVFTWNA
ncbi:MAG: RsmD family RNA methyltransferase, partial [Bdellovibrionales bacterium]|nr:RsmD family RNA methyltransferase [Bdellovibrionales bacterium]